MVCVLTRHPHIVEGLKNSRYIPLQRPSRATGSTKGSLATAVEIMSLSMEDVCSFLEEQAEDSSSLQQPSIGAAAAAAAGLNGCAAVSSSVAAAGMSHLCGWPGCGKGFSSRWALERHMKNHQPTSTSDGEQQPDSFVERRLRERLKSVQQALEKARDKLSQQARQQEIADAELREAQTQLQQQTMEIQLLSRRLSVPTGSMP